MSYTADAEPVSKGYILAAMMTVLAYDLACTLDDEITYVWSRPWSLGTCLFFLNRYLPFVDGAIALSMTRSITTPKSCHIYYTLYIEFLTCGVLLSEVILMLRTYAMWGKKIWTLVIFCPVTICIVVALIYTTYVSSQTIKFHPVPGNRYGCYVASHANNTSMIFHISVLISETIIVVLTSIKVLQVGNAGSWIRRMGRDGLMFYIYVLGVSMANIVITFSTNSPKYTNLLSNMERVVHSVCCTRVILLILAQRTNYRDSTPSLWGTSSYPGLERCLPYNCGTAPVFSTVIDIDNSLGDEPYEMEVHQEPAALPLDWIH